MGYTHYFSFTKPKGIPARVMEEKYRKALIECARVAHAWQRECADWERLSGYTAHTKLGTYGGLELNGKGDEAHEPLTLREHFSQNFEGTNPLNRAGGFVKTARKPYDTVIVACLAILQYRLGNAFKVSSDGDSSDWNAGIALASRVIRRKVPCPKGIRRVLTLVA